MTQVRLKAGRSVLPTGLLMAVSTFAVLAQGVVETGQLRLQGENIETYDNRLARVEKKARGFGGMFIDADGRLAVYLLDTAELPAARSAIESVFGAKLIPVSGVVALQGQYTVSQLKRWTALAGALLKTPGVTMVDMDEAKNRVAIGVADDSGTVALERALPSLRIPREAVVIQVTGLITPLNPGQP